MKREFAFALILLAVVGVVFGGGNQEGSTSEPIKLTVWCWDPAFNITSMNEAIKIYRRDHPDIEIEIVETSGSDLQQKIAIQLSANQTDGLPDIILMEDNAIQKNVINFPKAFMPLNDGVDLTQFAPFKLDVGTVDGKNYGVPFDNASTATFLRKDIIEAAGLKVSDFNDITWGKFNELGKIVKKKTGKSMFASVANEPDLVMIMLQSCGSWMFDKDGKPNIANNPVLIKGLQLFKDMVASGTCLVVENWNGYFAALANSNVAACIQGAWMIATIKAEKSQSGLWSLANTPKVDGIATATNYSSQGGSGWMVMASSKHPDIAMDFLNKTFAGSIELYEKILPISGAIATWLPAAKSKAYSQPDRFFGGMKVYEEIIKYSAQVPRVKYGVYNYEARNAIALAMNSVLQGMEIQKALAKAQKDVEFLMGY